MTSPQWGNPLLATLKDSIVLGDGEIRAPVYGLEKGGSELQMSGFEFMNMANYRLEDESHATDLFPYCSHKVITMMKNMDTCLVWPLERKEKR